MDDEQSTLSLPHKIDLGKFGVLTLSKTGEDCLYRANPEYDHSHEDGWAHYGALNLGTMTLQLPSYFGGFERTLEINGLDVDFKVKEGAELDDFSAYKNIRAGHSDIGPLAIYEGGPADFELRFLGLDFATAGENAMLNAGTLFASLPIGEELPIEDTGFSLEIDDPPTICFSWSDHAGDWAEGKWDMEQIRNARIYYWYKGAVLMFGGLKATPSGITVELELSEEFDDFPPDRAEMKRLKPAFVPPTGDQPWAITFD